MNLALATLVILGMVQASLADYTTCKPAAYGAWGAYSRCYKKCGDEKQVRTRRCNPGTCYDKECSGPASQSKDCGNPCCPQNGSYRSWGSWGSCKATANGCGPGQQSRRRRCRGASCGGKCSGPAKQNQACNAGCCPRDGVWSAYGAFGSCSVTCGKGRQCRERVCKGRACGGKRCRGRDKDCQSCQGRKSCCPVDGQWSSWQSGPAGQCSKTCGGGVRYRTRTCEGKSCGGKTCPGPSRDSVVCNKLCCPVDGQFASWGSWGRCNKSCGGGTQNRRRRCSGRKCRGKRCAGSSTQSRDCNQKCCAVNGRLTPWGAWQSCTVSCGGGTQLRDRECRAPRCKGAPCNPRAQLWENRPCNRRSCPAPSYGPPRRYD